MKRSLTILLSVFVIGLIITRSFAQNTSDTVLARIVYTNSTRLAILGKTVGVAKIDTLFTSNGNLTLRNLAVLASTKNGNSLLIAGKAVYPDPLNNSIVDSGWFIARIDAPFKNTGFVNPLSTPVTLGGAKLLKIIFSDQSNNPFLKILPIGALTPNEQEWYATPTKVSEGGGQQWFFHGRFDGTGNVDSVQVTGSPASVPDYPGYHMTNLVTSDDGSAMLCVVFDGINGVNSRCQVFNWIPSTPSGSIAFQANVITSLVQALRPHINYPDTVFAFSLHTVAGQGICELSLTPTTKGDLTYFTFPIGGSINSIVPSSNPPHSIARSVLPKGTDGKTLQFFTGYTGSPQNAYDDKEVFSPASGYPNGNGGDMMFSPSGDSVVFITCRSDATATAQESGIYIYDFNTQKVTLVQNDTTLMERQPIFAGSVVHKYVAPPPPPYVPGIARLDSTALNFGVDSIVAPPGTTPTVQTSFKFLDTSASKVTITNLTAFMGNNAGAFTLVSPTSFPMTIAARQSQTFTISFKPSIEQTYNATLQIHYTDSLTAAESKDSVLSIPITGIGIKKKPTGGVSASTPVSFDLFIAPNPFTSSTQITISARETGSSSLEIRDLLGKEIYSSKSFILASGEKYSYTLDANNMHLSPGTYFVIVRSNGEELTRQALYIK